MKQTLFLVLFTMLMVSCGSKKTATQEISKSDMIAKWGVESIAGLDNPSTNLTLNLNLENNTVAGFGGCNNFSGGAERDGSKISFPTIINTMMVCDNSDVENAYMKALGKVHSFGISKNILTFYDMNGKPLIKYVKMTR